MSDSKRGPRKNKAAEVGAAAAAQAAQPAAYDPAALLCKFENDVVVVVFHDDLGVVVHDVVNGDGGVVHDVDDL